MFLLETLSENEIEQRAAFNHSCFSCSAQHHSQVTKHGNNARECRWERFPHRGETFFSSSESAPALGLELSLLVGLFWFLFAVLQEQRR